MRSYKVYNCKSSRDLELVTCMMQGNFSKPESALARLAECTGVRAWIEKSGRDVTAEMIEKATPEVKVRLAEKSLSYGMKFGRGLRGSGL